MVDWALARQIARFASGNAPIGKVGGELSKIVPEVEEPVAGYTGLKPAGTLPSAETLDRDGWAEINLGPLASLLDPVAERLEQRTSSAGPLAGPIRAAAGATLAAEAGLVVGYMSQR